jgi:hypothetical protein
LEIPLPLVMKLNKGILYIPNTYQIKEGLASAMSMAIQNLENIEKDTLKVAIFDSNQLSDNSLSMLLDGLSRRAEFSSFTSIQNELGEKSIKQIDYMLHKLSELRLVNNFSSHKVVE